ncbi:hypothetical protein BDC45DRAFT_529662 [Circinella umbellata]|nr:hypothetical protein BDC45DRAFT_529662 [Circinella umbellata]
MAHLLTCGQITRITVIASVFTLIQGIQIEFFQLYYSYDEETFFNSSYYMLLSKEEHNTQLLQSIMVSSNNCFISNVDLFDQLFSILYHYTVITNISIANKHKRINFVNVKNEVDFWFLRLLNESTCKVGGIMVFRLRAVI